MTPLGLIKILQSQVRPEFKRAQLQTQLARSFRDLSRSGSLREAEVAECQLNGLQLVASLRGRKTIISEEPLRRHIHRDRVSLRFLDQLTTSTVLMMAGQSGFRDV